MVLCVRANYGLIMGVNRHKLTNVIMDKVTFDHFDMCGVKFYNTPLKVYF
jgi:hypothetical protein